MTNEQASTPRKSTLDLAKEFFAAKERHDLESTMALFAETSTYAFPLNASGESSVWFKYEGKANISKYQQGVLERFSHIHMNDQQFFETKNATTVFVECKGAYIAKDSGRAYNNVYVFKFESRDGLLVELLEYANPVTYAKLANLPIG